MLKSLPALVFVFVIVARAALAQAPGTVFLEDLTWTELRDQIGAGKTTIIVPIGGVEQSGPDMALGKHDVRVRALSQKIALALGNALVAPVIAYVPEGGPLRVAWIEGETVQPARLDKFHKALGR